MEVKPKAQKITGVCVGTYSREITLGTYCREMSLCSEVLIPWRVSGRSPISVYQGDAQELVHMKNPSSSSSIYFILVANETRISFALNSR